MQTYQRRSWTDEVLHSVSGPRRFAFDWTPQRFSNSRRMLVKCLLALHAVVRASYHFVFASHVNSRGTSKFGSAPCRAREKFSRLRRLSVTRCSHGGALGTFGFGSAPHMWCALVCACCGNVNSTRNGANETETLLSHYSKITLLFP